MDIENREKEREAARSSESSPDRQGGGGRGEYGKPPPRELLDMLPKSPELLELADAN